MRKNLSLKVYQNLSVLTVFCAILIFFYSTFMSDANIITGSGEVLKYMYSTLIIPTSIVLLLTFYLFYMQMKISKKGIEEARYGSRWYVKLSDFIYISTEDVYLRQLAIEIEKAIKEHNDDFLNYVLDTSKEELKLMREFNQIAPYASQEHINKFYAEVSKVLENKLTFKAVNYDDDITDLTNRLEQI